MTTGKAAAAARLTNPPPNVLKYQRQLTGKLNVPNTLEIPKFFAVDFYCGAGGTTRGLLDAGGYVIAGIDKDSGCHDTFVLNNPNRKLDGGRSGVLGEGVPSWSTSMN